MSESLHRQLTLDALQSTIEGRQPQPGLIHHSDRAGRVAAVNMLAMIIKKLLEKQE